MHVTIASKLWYSNDPKTDKSGQTMQTQQSDQGLHCLLFHLHLLDTSLSGLTSLFEIKGHDSKILWNFTVIKFLNSISYKL